MILWSQQILHKESFVNRLESEILSNFKSDSNFYSTYSDWDHPPDLISEELSKEVFSFYKDKSVEMMKDVGIDGYIKYKVKPYDIWVQMNNQHTDSHPVHDHHGQGSFVSWVHVVKALPDQLESFYFVNSSGDKTYPPQETGRMFAFPSWALHGVEPAEREGNRIIVAGNVSFDRSK
jgi:hypothetical protein